MSARTLVLGAACAASITGSLASAQFQQSWVAFEPGDDHLGLPPEAITNDATFLPGDTPIPGALGVEADLAWADLDKDGWTDLVVARKQPFTTAGKRTNLLLKNEGGVLVDRTAAYASLSDVPGDQGFLTPTNDRDVVIADLDGDTWLDLVTATTLGDGDPKHVSHPRIYRNLGRDAAGAWLGFRHEDARIPQLLLHASGQPAAPRFSAVAVGDVTGDGAPDLYFVDHDASGSGGAGEPLGGDLDDRLLVNDGHGWFTDESLTRMSPDMLLSAYGTAAAVADLNADGHADVVKASTLSPPQSVRALYNDPASPGFFTLEDPFHQLAPAHVSVDDLNQDGRLDVVISDDGLDRWRVNLGNDALGRVIWSAAKTFGFLVGGDDGFAGATRIADLDQDGWNDVLICDVDADVPGKSRRLHVYHNRGGTAGGSDLVLREERESASDAGWIGVVGLTEATMEGTQDVAVLDIDNDLDPDLVLARFEGTHLFVQEGGVVCQPSIGYGGPGFSQLSVCGGDLSVLGQSADVELTGAPASAPSVWAISGQKSPVSIGGGFLVAFPPLALGTFTTGPGGEVHVPAALTGDGSGATLYLQAATLDLGLPALWSISNAVEIQL